MTKAVGFNMRFADAYAWLGEVRTYLGNPDGIGLIRRAITLDPTEARYRLRAASVLMSQGKAAEARADAQAALSLAETDQERNEAQRLLDAATKAAAAPAPAVATTPAAARPTPAAAVSSEAAASPVAPAAAATPTAPAATPTSPAPAPARAPAAAAGRPSPPLSRAALDELNTACQSGDASACTKLLPVVEAECAQKIPAACRFAGFLYERGRGVAANAAMAASFYNQSCEAGDKMGCIGFALLQARGTGVIQNEAKAQATLSQLCQEGVLEACTQLAVLDRAITDARRHGACAGAPDEGLRRQARARVRDVEVDAEGAGEVTSVAEDERERDVETGEERRGKHVASLARELHGPGEAVALAAIDANHVDLRIDDPVFDDGRVLVQAALDRLVALASAGRPNLHDQVRRSHYVLAREKISRAFVRDI